VRVAVASRLVLRDERVELHPAACPAAYDARIAQRPRLRGAAERARIAAPGLLELPRAAATRRRAGAEIGLQSGVVRVDLGLHGIVIARGRAPATRLRLVHRPV